MNFLMTLVNSDVRIPLEYRRDNTIDAMKRDIINIEEQGVLITNPHILNLRSLLFPTAKQVEKIEVYGQRHTMDLEINDDSHSYYANGIPVHNTINVPFDYPFESFKDLYLNAYETGFIKGLTTYRAGTMTTVLAAKDEKTASADQEEIVQGNVTIPAQSPAVMNTIKAEGKKYYLTTIMDSDMKRPIALFVTTNHHEKSVTTHDAVERLLSLAREKKIPEEWITDTEQKIVNDTNVNKLARTISLLLRHGVFIKNIVFVLDQVEDVYVGTFLFQIKKYLSQYIKDGEKVEGKTCDNCGSSNIVYSEGCFACKDCSSSKCG